MLKRLISLCLVLALLICCSPIQAHAAATGTTAVLIGGSLVAAAVLTGIGIKAAQNDTTVFDALCDSLRDAWATAGFIASAASDVALLYNAVTGQYKIPQSMVQTALDYAYSSGSFTGSFYSYSFGDITLWSDTPMLIFWTVNDYGYCRVCGISNSVVSLSSPKGSYSYRDMVVNGSRYYLNSTNVGYDVYDTSFVLIHEEPLNYFFNYINSHTLPSSLVASGLESAGTIAAPGSVATGYPDWAAGSSEEQNPDDPDQVIPYWPIGLPASVAGAGSLTQSDVWQGIGDFVQTVPATLDSINAGITGFWNDTKAFFSNIGTKVDTMIAALAAIAASVGQDLFNGVSSIIDLLRSWSAAAVDFFSRSWVNFTTAAQNAWTSITSTLSEILNWIKSLPAAIASAISSLLSSLFVPDVAEISAAVDTMKVRFPFFDSIIGTWKQFQLVLSGGPPVIYAHLENAEGHFNYGGTVAILDMNFYTRYKSIGDAVLSAALWAFFAWRTFVKLPGLISGASGDAAVIDEVDKKW